MDDRRTRMECPICGHKRAKIITRENGTRYVKCSKCKERFVPSYMMDENLKILAEIKGIEFWK